LSKDEKYSIYQQPKQMLILSQDRPSSGKMFHNISGVRKSKQKNPVIMAKCKQQACKEVLKINFVVCKKDTRPLSEIN
jgi:hypothetical protein